MIGLDTNVLVRLLTADEPAQLKVATALLAANEGRHGVFYVDDLVLVELIWVLRRVYGFDRHGALQAVTALLDNDAFAFENRERLHRAVALCSDQSRDFADAMIAQRNADASCEYTASFDKSVGGLSGMRLLA